MINLRHLGDYGYESCANNLQHGGKYGRASFALPRDLQRPTAIVVDGEINRLEVVGATDASIRKTYANHWSRYPVASSFVRIK